MADALLAFLGKYTGEVTAVCALALTVFQAVATRRHNILSVHPHLSPFTHRDTTDGRAVLVHRIMNNGIGPAFIRSYQVYLDGKPVADPNEAVDAVVPIAKYSRKVTRLADDYAISAGESVDVLVLKCALENGETIDQVENELSRLDLVIAYASAYKKAMMLDTRERKGKTLTKRSR